MRKTFSLCPIRVFTLHMFSSSHSFVPLIFPLLPPPSLFLFQFSSSKIRFLDKIRFFVDPLLFFSCRFSFQNFILSQHNHHFTSITVVMTHRPFLSISTSTSSASPLEASSQISTADKDGQFKAKCSNGLSALIVHPDTYYFTQLCYGGFDAQRL